MTRLQAAHMSLKAVTSKQTQKVQAADLPAPSPIRVLIVDDHAVVREGIRMILTSSGEFDVVGEAGDGVAAVHLARALRPNVVVMDVSMPKLNGIEATQQIKALVADVHVLILTMHEDESYIFQLLKFGASGYVLKRAAATDLVDAVRAAARGEAFLFPAVARSLVRDYLDHLRIGKSGLYDGLIEREREVLTLIAEGLTSTKIAEKLSISVEAVQTQRTHIIEKLDLHDRSQLVRYAVRKGLISA
jgi:NarL family two-component system response regulator LiaR